MAIIPQAARWTIQPFLSRVWCGGGGNPKYATNTHRMAEEKEIYQVIGDWVAQRSMEEVLGAMKEASVPSGPILSTADLIREEQYQVRNMFQTVRPPPGEGGVEGEEVTVPAMLPVLSGTPGRTTWAGPALGQHTREVLTEVLGMGQAEFEALRGAKVI